MDETMNRIYRTVWNESLGAYVAVSENDSALCKGKGWVQGLAVGEVGLRRPIALRRSARSRSQ